jgi:hypothetical protein
MWFAQAEAQFSLASITSEKTNFNYVISQVEYRHAAEVEDIISHPADETYSTLKTELVRLLSSSRDQRVRQLLTYEQMGDRKGPVPSTPEEPGTGRAGKLPEEHMVQQAAALIHTILAGQTEGNLEAVSQLAVWIAEVAPLPTTASIA